MATSNIQVTAGSGTYLATHSISEDAVTKQIQRVGLVTSAGTEEGVAATPLQVSLANHGANATPVLVDLGPADTLGTVTTVGTVNTVTALTTCSTVTNLAQINGVASALNTGVRSAGTLRVTVATDDVVPCVGTIADDSTTPGNPVMIGGSAVETDGSDPTSVSAEADVARCRTDRNRRLLVNTFHPALATVNAVYGSAQTDTQLIAAPVSGSIYVTDIIVSNGGTAGTVKFEEATAGARTQKTATFYMAVNSSISCSFATPIRCTATTNFGVTSVTVVAHSVQVNYFVAP